jgi:hypothetical protein
MSDNSDNADSDASTVEYNTNYIRKKLLSEDYYNSLDQTDNTYIKCIKTNKLIIISFLVSLTIGICFVFFMYN